MGSGLRIGEDIGMVGLENQNEYNCIITLPDTAKFRGKIEGQVTCVGGPRNPCKTSEVAIHSKLEGAERLSRFLPKKPDCIGNDILKTYLKEN
jgi:hypothetical protein